MKQFQEDYDTIIELAKFKVHTIFIFMGYHCDQESLLLRCNIFESVKTALTKKNIMRQVKPECLGGEDGEPVAENEEENESDAEGSEVTNGGNLESNLKNLNARDLLLLLLIRIQVEVDLKGARTSGSRTAAGRGRGRGKAAEAEKKETGRGTGSKRKS
ncbi:unnamed protein product [Brassica oleracea]